ncbi:uncharacterized protein LOC130685958 [Daphnia carinata]|uniref:uncharacterized protein LOC130685958 n=1 Tax=Daphnia carinata TaxID=120202 RepID=UPI00257D001E|nr:uncharacterized protein LOC130685958 [Daphnia carinata]
MHFTASSAIIVLAVCMASTIDASKLPVTKMMSQRTMMHRPSSQTNININENDNENYNFLFSSLISELLANMSQDSDQDPCDSDDDDDSCFWNIITANLLAKSAKTAKKTEKKVIADDGTDKPILEKVMDDSKSLRSRHGSGPSNFNFNSNSNENTNIDISSAFASLQQFLKNKNRKLAKATVKKD